MKEIKGVLFDFDGVILDTDNSYRKLVANLLTTEFNYPITHQECIERWKGKNGDQIARELFFEGYDFADDFVTRVNELSNTYKVDDSIKVKNVVELLDFLKQQNLPMVICSNGRSVRILNNLKDLNMADYFVKILGRDNLGVMKPNPEVYLKGAEFLNLDIENCLVVEDSATGLSCAVNAGAISVGFTGTGVLKQDLEPLNPDYIINDLLELKEIIKNNK